MSIMSINSNFIIGLKYENYTFGYNPVENQFSAIGSLPFCNLTKRIEENFGWRWKLTSSKWYNILLSDYHSWDVIIDQEFFYKTPPFVKLKHIRTSGKIESNILCNEWDDIANGEFYQRDWTSSSLPFVDEGEEYWSGWWFSTISEFNRFRNFHNCEEVMYTKVV